MQHGSRTRRVKTYEGWRKVQWSSADGLRTIAAPPPRDGLERMGIPLALGACLLRQRRATRDRRARQACFDQPNRGRSESIERGSSRESRKARSRRLHRALSRGWTRVQLQSVYAPTRSFGVTKRSPTSPYRVFGIRHPRNRGAQAFQKHLLIEQPGLRASFGHLVVHRVDELPS